MKLNKVLVVGIIGILLVCLFTFKKDNKQEEYVLKDRIEVNDSYNSIAMYQVDGDEEKKITEMPESGYVIDSDSSYCVLKGEKEHDDQAKLYTNSNGEHIIGNLAPEERCFVKFVKLSDKTLAELDLHSQGTVEDFSKTACIGDCDTQEENGVFEVEDDFGTSYYFRGTVQNNWVKFGKISTSGADIYWRIIRINGDGTIRLIYSGNSSAAETGTSTQIDSTYNFNSSTGNNMYVGYQFVSGNAHGFGKDNQQSNVLKELNTWFKNNLTDEWNNGNGRIDSNAGFCNDRSNSTVKNTTWIENMADSGGTGTTDTYYGAYLRLTNNGNSPTEKSQAKPILKCSTTSHKNEDYFTYIGATGIKQNGTDTIITGTKSLEYPVGLITADEVSFAGGLSYRVNYGYWLHTDKNYWTMSPFSLYNKSAAVFGVHESGQIYGGSMGNLFGLRPVINLKADTKFKFDKPDEATKGTSSNPYIVSN